MTSSPPFLLELSARPPSPLEKCFSDSPYLAGSPPPSRKGFNPILTLELPLAPRKGYSDHPDHAPGLSPNPGKACSDSPLPLDSPNFSRDPFCGLTCRPGISSLIATPPSLPRLIPSAPPPPPSPPPQPPLRPRRCSFEPCSPLLGRPFCREPILSCSPPSSPCFDRFSLLGSPPVRPRSPYCSWISPPRIPRPCPRSPCIDQQTYLCYCGGYPSALVTSPGTSPSLAHRPVRTSPVTSPMLPHGPLETGHMISSSITPGSQGTCPITSPTLTHRSLGTALVISPPLAHRAVEIRSVVSPPLSHRVLETGPVISPLLCPWSSGRSYNDPPPSPTSSPLTDSFCHSLLKPPDPCEPKPQLDLPLGKNCCGSPLSSQAGTSGSPSSPQEGSFHYSHISQETHIPAPGSPCCALRLPAQSTCSPCSPQSQAPVKPCFESIFTWETGGNSCLFVEPGTAISCPPCPKEPPLSLSSHCPYSVFSFPSPLSNQFISPPQSPPRRSYNEPPFPTPAGPQVKSPKSTELKQPRALHRCRSLIIPLQHTTLDLPRPPKACASPPPPSHPSGPSCTVTSFTTCSNPCPKELPQGTPLPTVIPRTLKPVLPTCLPLRLPFCPVPPSSCVQSTSCGLPVGPPCSTHIYSVVPPTSDPCPLLGPPQCHKLTMVPPCGTFSAPRGPPQPHCQPVPPPCSTHIYSFIPLRTPFDPQSLPIAPQARGHPMACDTMPCGLHVYSVAPRGCCKETPKVPYSCPLPSTKTSSCSTDLSCGSAVVISECQSSDNQSKKTHQGRNRSQAENTHHTRRSRSQSKSLRPQRSQSRNGSPSSKRSRSPSSSPHQSPSQDKSEGLQCSGNQGQSESSQRSKGQGMGKSTLHDKSQSGNKSPRHGKRRGHSKSPHQSRSRSKSPRPAKSHGRNKSPRHNKK
ncbi:sperm head and tail associated protein-like [Lontra canadensis]|uniref:sperm head and tail associated protein-like n=1 Tax=Lontra canadensis TaxID=76717 RepID=UPI0013F2D632|nr:sperm head and tail associated protein-like [Lontra canadensis]